MFNEVPEDLGTRPQLHQSRRSQSPPECDSRNLIDAPRESRPPAAVYTSRSRRREVAGDGELTGGKVLPGFRVSLRDLFGALRRKKRKPR